MARHSWGAALTRDGLEHADVLAVHTATRRLVEVQVKTASFMPKPNWRLNLKAQEPSRTDHESFVLVALGSSSAEGTRAFVVPRTTLRPQRGSRTRTGAPSPASNQTSETPA